MSAELPRSGRQDIVTKPTRRQFVRSGSTQRLAPEAAARQGQVTNLALRVLGDRDRALAFLNTHHPELGGRPLDIAITGAGGLAAVAGALNDQARLDPSAPS